MPYNEAIDNRIRKAVSKWKNTDSKKMFGGVCYLLNGNMVCGVYKDYLCQNPVAEMNMIGRIPQITQMLEDSNYIDEKKEKDHGKAKRKSGFYLCKRYT